MTSKITAGESFTLHLGDNLATLKNYPDNTFDSIVTDPPYGIEFLGKDWDSHTGTLDLYKECLRVLKPGGYLLAFSAARTYHQLASNIELAGFEIRDQLMWLYASGFPKAQDIGKAIQKRIGVEQQRERPEWKETGCGLDNFSRNLDGGSEKESGNETICTSPLAKQWEGFKTALKPAHEPIVMARKPFKGSTIDNVLKNGLGALNIDATRVPWADEADQDGHVINIYENGDNLSMNMESGESAKGTYKKKKSDKPQAGSRTKTFGSDIGSSGVSGGEKEEGWECDNSGRYPSNVIGEVEEGYQKYFYCPKVSRKERHSGFEAPPVLENYQQGDVKNHPDWDPSIGTNVQRLKEKIKGQSTATNTGNNHPTVKPVALMDYLIKLVTPPSTDTLQRKVLDPFMGSGSTGMAATALGHHFTGCELDPKYVAIAETRITAWMEPEPKETPDNNFNELFQSYGFLYFGSYVR